jgi:hypothetical protein
VALPDGCFESVYKAFGWPGRVYQVADDAKKKQIADREHFMAQLKTDSETFAEELEAWDVEIQALKSLDDMSQVEANSQTVNALQAKIDDGKERAALYNSREELFGWPVTTYGQLAELNKGLEPYSAPPLTPSVEPLNACASFHTAHALATPLYTCMHAPLLTVACGLRVLPLPLPPLQVQLALDDGHQLPARVPHLDGGPLHAALARAGRVRRLQLGPWVVQAQEGPHRPAWPAQGRRSRALSCSEPIARSRGRARVAAWLLTASRRPRHEPCV